MEWMILLRGGRTKASLEAHVGGRFQIDMIGEGKTYPHEREYLRLERPRLIEFSWISEATERQRSVVRVEEKVVLLKNKNAVIYGGGGAIGGAVARAFAREGARVFLAGALSPGSRR
jgi:uncharacterized protein YndB with AHSA1/START domain